MSAWYDYDPSAYAQSTANDAKRKAKDLEKQIMRLEEQIRTLERQLNPPAADVVPVVRCKDCAWATIIAGECADCARLGDIFQTFNKVYLKGDFYCAFGERREVE